MKVQTKIVMVLTAANLLSACGENLPATTGGAGYNIGSLGATQPATPATQVAQQQQQQQSPAAFPGYTPVVPLKQSTNPISTQAAEDDGAAAAAAAEARRMQIVATISGYYRTYLDRDPEAAGLNYWVSQALGGASLNSIQIAIANSPEAQARNASIAREQFRATIASYYRIYLGREPDQAGLNYWVNAAVQSNSVEVARAGIANSPEAQIRSSYIRNLNREPDAPGLAYWVGQANNGVPLSTIDNAIRLSPEAQIRNIYRIYLRREPDSAGFAYWLGQAANGVPLSQIDIAIRNSPEALGR